MRWSDEPNLIRFYAQMMHLSIRVPDKRFQHNVVRIYLPVWPARVMNVITARGRRCAEGENHEHIHNRRRQQHHGLRER